MYMATVIHCGVLIDKQYQQIEKEIMATFKIIKSFLLEIEMWIHKDFDPIVFQ